MENDVGTLVELEPLRNKKLATDHLLDLADLALASNGLGDNCINRGKVRMQLKHLPDADTREYIQILVNSEIERVYGEYAADFIKPLSSYENELEGYKTSLQEGHKSVNAAMRNELVAYLHKFDHT